MSRAYLILLDMMDKPQIRNAVTVSAVVYYSPFLTILRRNILLRTLSAGALGHPSCLFVIIDGKYHNYKSINQIVFKNTFKISVEITEEKRRRWEIRQFACSNGSYLCL
jgi:hypothetical protein